MFFDLFWIYKASGTDGDCKLFGVNIFEFERYCTDKKVTVKDPIYFQKHTFLVYTVKIKGKTKRFAAGEFSNCVWEFYV